MPRSQGFTLTEVLISFSLLITISLMLLRVQGHMQRLLNQNLMLSEALLYLDNNGERLLANQPLSLLTKPFDFSKKADHEGIQLTVSWEAAGQLKETCCHLQRHYVILP